MGWTLVLLLAVLTAAAPGKGRPEMTVSPMSKQTPSESTDGGPAGEPAQSLVRLVNGTSRCGGTVQLRHQGEWATLCSEFALLMTADIICRELQCGTARNLVTTTDKTGPDLQGNGTVITANRSSAFFLSIHCPGPEEGLENCSITRLSPGNCPTGRPAVISCTEHRELRLVGGRSPCAGRVEFEIDGRWGTVCDDSWDLHDADVVCHQLRCGSALQVLGASYFGKGVGPIYLDEVNCTGNESYLWDCPAEEHHDCGHKEDAGVTCAEHRELRLSGGRDHCSGRAEVYFHGTWATLCDTVWFPEDRDLLCRFLGCGAAVSQLQFHHTLPSRIGFLCEQNVISPWDCKHFFNNENVCSQSAAVGVICTGSLGLLSTTTAMEGAENMSSTSSGTVRGVPGVETSKDPALLSVCVILAGLLLGTLMAFAWFVFRRRKKQAVAPVLVNHSLQTSNVSSTESNDYQNPISRIPDAEVPSLSPSHHLSEDSDYEDYDFSNSLRYKPIDDGIQQKYTPMASLQEDYQDAEGADSESILPEKAQEREHCHNQPISTALPPASSTHTAPPYPSSAALSQASQVAEDSSSTSSDEEGWYENYKAPRAKSMSPQAGSVPPLTEAAAPSLGPHSQEDSTDGEYDDIDSAT